MGIEKIQKQRGCFRQTKTYGLGTGNTLKIMWGLATHLTSPEQALGECGAPNAAMAPTDASQTQMTYRGPALPVARYRLGHRLLYGPRRGSDKPPDRDVLAPRGVNDPVSVLKVNHPRLNQPLQQESVLAVALVVNQITGVPITLTLSCPAAPSRRPSAGPETA